MQPYIVRLSGCFVCGECAHFFIAKFNQAFFTKGSTYISCAANSMMKEIFLTPQNLGGGGCIPLDVAVVSITLLVTGGLIGSRFNHLYYMLTPPPRDIYTYNNSTKTLFELAHILVVFAACTFCDASSTNESRPPP